MMRCLLCNKPLSGRKTKFCCRKHMLQYNNANLQCYTKQKVRGFERKLLFIQSLGGKCSICGYSKNIAALCFHHTAQSTKDFGLDARHFSNSSLETLKAELSKCILVCSNCHAELHHPDLLLTI